MLLSGACDAGGQVKALAVAADAGMVQLKHLESLVSEAARIFVHLPEAKVRSPPD